MPGTESVAEPMSTEFPGRSTSLITAKRRPVSHSVYKGIVVSLDSTSESFVVHPAKGEDVTLKVNDKTKYSPKGKGWDDIKVHAKVSGSYRNDGSDHWALTVRLWPEPRTLPAKS
jgi:hypothetical protein